MSQAEGQGVRLSPLFARKEMHYAEGFPFFGHLRIMPVLDRMLTLELVKTVLAVVIVLVTIIVSRKFLAILTKAIEGEVAGETLMTLLGLKILSAFIILLPAAQFLAILKEKPDDTETTKRLEADSRFLLESKRQRLESMGATDVSTDLASGEPAWEILDRAKEGDFSIIVMGSTGKGFVKGVFLGSVSNEVARHAELPVLLIPAVR